MGKIKHKKQNKSSVKKTFLLSGYFLVITACLIIPLIYIKTALDPVLYPRFLALGILVFILTGLIYFEIGKKKLPISLYTNGFTLTFLLFILVSILSLLFAINPIEGLTDIFKWLLIFILTLLATYLMLNSNSLFNLLLKGVVINVLLFSMIGIVQYLENALMNSDPNAIYEVNGLMAHKNQFSISLFVLIPFLLSAFVNLNNIWKKFAALATILALIVILILQTRAVWLGLFISSIITVLTLLIINSRKEYIHLRNKTLKMAILVGTILMILFLGLIVFYPVGPLETINERINSVFNPNYASNEWRIEIWEATLQLIKDEPLTGVGAGNWKISIYPYYSEYLPSVFRQWNNPHNDYLLVFSEKGVFGLLCFISMFLFLIYYVIRNMTRATSIKSMLTYSFFLFGIFGYMVISFFSFPNERINHLIFISLMAAFIISEYLKYNEGLNEMGLRKAWVAIPIFVLAYLAIHLGIVSVNSEINIVKAQEAKSKQNWNAMEKYALKAYSNLAPLEPKFSFPVSMYPGLAKFHKGEFKDALVYFKKAYYQHPTNIPVMNNIGSVYGQMGMLDSSIVYNKKTLAIFPHYESGLVNLARAYYLDKDFENAYKTILCCDPKSTNKEVRQIRNVIESKLN